jgi:hypothetical protein
MNKQQRQQLEELKQWTARSLERDELIRTIEETATETPMQVKAKIPKQYHDYWKVFSDLQSQHFPPSRPWDHAINLKPGAPAMLPAKVYPAPPKEQDYWQQFTREGLKKGYIRIGDGPYATPTFTILKKNGKLRPVQDYRALNAWTIRNRYPLPLISQLID